HASSHGEPWVRRTEGHRAIRSCGWSRTCPRSRVSRGELGGRVANRSSPHGHDDVAIAYDTADRIGHSGNVFNENRLDLAGHPHGTNQRATVGCDDRGFTGRIDL